MAVKTIAFMLPWVDPLSANSNLYNAGVIARIETSIADRAITAGKALEINANIFDQSLNTTDSPTFAGLTVDTNTLFVNATNNRVGIGTTSPSYALDVNGDIALSGQLLLADGSEAAPALAMGSDTDTGFYKSSNAQWRFAIGGTDKFVFSSDYLRVPAGTLGAPGYAFESDANTGFYSVSNGVFAAACNGVEILRLTGSKVGIGTISPSKKLHVNTTGATVAEFSRTDNGQILELDGSGYSGHHTLDGIAYFIGHNSGSRGLGLQTASTTRLFIAGAGNVGIGTTNPATRLHVTSASADIATFEAPATGGQIRLYRGTSFGWDIGITGGSSFTIGPDGGSTYLTLDTTGNLGLGTTSPEDKLHVAGSIRLESASDNGYVFWEEGTGGTGIAALYNGTGNRLDFVGGTGNDPTAFVTTIMTMGRDSGRVGIGTTNPSQALDVFGIAQASRFYVTDGNAVIERSSGALNIQTFAGNNILLNSGGNVGIGTTSPVAQCEIVNSSTGRAWAASSITELLVERNGTAAVAIIGSSGASSRLYFGDTDDENVGSLEYDHSTDSLLISVNTSEVGRFTSTGLGIGTTSPGAKLHVNGTVRLQNLPTSASGLSAGDLWNDGGTLKIA